MKNHAEFVINKNIELVKNFLDGSEENLKRMDSNIVSNTPIEETEKRIGSRYLQKYQEGKKIQEYEVLVTDYKNSPATYILAMQFQLGTKIMVKVLYDITKVDENNTKIIYHTDVEPLSLLYKIIFKLTPNKTGNKVCLSHLQKISELV